MKNLIACAGALAFGGGALGQVSYVSGVQTNSGHISLTLGGPPPLQDSYSESAPVATGSWSPAPHDISETGGSNQVHLATSWMSTLEAGHLGFHAVTTDASMVIVSAGPSAHFDYDKIFDVTVHLDSAQLVQLSAAVLRNNVGGFASGTPCSMQFGPVGGSPIFSLSYAGQAPNFDGEFPQTTVQLDAGDYRLLAQDHNVWDGGLHGSNIVTDDLRFDLLVVPSPGVVVVAGVIGVLTTRRRR
jgi:hypothetical protein